MLTGGAQPRHRSNPPPARRVTPYMGLLVDLLFFLAILAIVYWTYTQLTLPPPVRMIAAVVMALIAIVFLFSIVGSGGGFTHLWGARC